MRNVRKRPLPIGTLLMFVAAAALLLASSIGSAQAALTYFSEVYNSQVELYNIGVTLLENGEKVAYRDYHKREAQGEWVEGGTQLLSKMIDKEKGERVQFGKAYPEVLTVQNSGTIDEFVRVNIYKYWVKVENGVETKCQDLSPAMIHLELDNTDMWVEDKDAATDERMVLYYNAPLAVEETAVPFSKSLTIDGSLAKFVTKTTVKEGNKIITRTTFDYNGMEFRLEVEANAVQTHNAEDAIMSAWGRDVHVEAAADKQSLRLR